MALGAIAAQLKRPASSCCDCCNMHARVPLTYWSGIPSATASNESRIGDISELLLWCEVDGEVNQV